MTTPTQIEYALMAGASYISNRDPNNRFPAPDVWLESINQRKTKPSGFEATYFTNGSNLVISFAGTDFSKGIPELIIGDRPRFSGSPPPKMPSTMQRRGSFAQTLFSIP